MKTVLITGVLGGIGKSLAKTFKVNNYFVIGLDLLNGENEFVDYFLQFDLNQYCEDDVYRNMFNKIFDEKITSINVLVNNAAVQLLGGITDIKLSDWKHTMNVNLTGPMLLSQKFFSLLEANSGSIINISSIHEKLTKKRFVAYATSKSALIGLTKSLSVDFEGRVRVNSISPAAINTPMLLDGFNNDISKISDLDKIHPLQRIGRPDEVSQLAYLLAESNLGFINGANICIDGGISNVLRDLE